MHDRKYIALAAAALLVLFLGAFAAVPSFRAGLTGMWRSLLGDRGVSFDIPDWEQLHIPKSIMDLADMTHGMVLVTGTAGSGEGIISMDQSILNLYKGKKSPGKPPWSTPTIRTSCSEDWADPIYIIKRPEEKPLAAVFIFLADRSLYMSPEQIDSLPYRQCHTASPA